MKPSAMKPDAIKTSAIKTSAMKPSEIKNFWKPAIVSAALSALFLVVYSTCNWITSLRPNVGSFYFAWERHIPFVPAMILPYMSIDLFFIGSPFLARSPRELRTLAARITTAILVAGACFLILPLKFAFDRPHVDGLLGLIFNNFRNLDKPFNEFPSLHIALWAILADIYLRHTRGLLRGLIAVWFILIALSTVLTYQHHVIDILGGFALAIICFHLFSEDPLRQPFTPNRRIAIYYIAGAILLTALSFARLPWTGILLWPAFSLVLIASAYLWLGPGIFRKSAGKHSWTTALLLGPALLGQRLSLIHYARRGRPYDRLTDHLWIGRYLTPALAREIRAKGVTAVIDLTGEFTEPLLLRQLHYLPLPILDLTAPTPEQIDQAIAFIDEHGEGIVYLHCKAGYSRTGAIAGAYLVANGDCENAEQAIAKLRLARRGIILRPEAIAAIKNFDQPDRSRAGAASEV